MPTGNPHSVPSSARRSVRKAQARDAPVIAALVASAGDLRQVAPLESYPLDGATVLHWLLERDAGLVLEDRGEIVAYGELVPDRTDSGRLWIGHMIVHPRRRGLGLGQRLVHELVRIAEHDRGAREVAISAFADNERALRCYAGCGFVRVDQERIEGRPLVGMRLRFDSRFRSPGLRASLVLASAALLSGSLAAGPRAWSMVTESPWVLLSPIGIFLGAWLGHRLGAERAEPWLVRLRAALRPVGLGIFCALGVGLLMLALSGESEFVQPLLTVYGSATLVWVALLGAWLKFESR